MSAAINSRVLLRSDGSAIITRNESALDDVDAPLLSIDAGATVEVDGVVLNGTVLVRGGQLDIRNTEVGYLTASNSGGGSGRRLQDDGTGARAALRVLGGSTTLSGCTFAGLVASHGSAINMLGGRLTVDGSTFINNQASADGGAILIMGGELVLSNSRFEGNAATGSGGAIAMRGGSADILTCNFTDNWAGGDGGGLVFSGGTARLYAGTLLSANRAQNGGAISSDRPPPGGAQTAAAVVDIQDATLYNNTATAAGGGLLVASGVVRVIGGLVEMNFAEEGGGASVSTGTLMLMNGALLRANVATVGISASVGDGELRFVLPTRAGYWMPSTKTCTLDGAFQPCQGDADTNAMVGRVYSTFSAGMLDENYPLTCPAGLYGTNESNSQTKSSCAGECPAGTWSGAGSTLEDCIICQPGTFCESGSPSETAVPSGRFSNRTGVGSVRETWECPLGHECMPRSIEPVQCGVGFHAPMTGLGACLPCPMGTYQDEVGTWVCKNCTLGHYCPLGSFVPTPCPAGKWSNQYSLGSETECTMCPPANYCLEGSTQPSACPAGVFGAEDGLRDVGCTDECAPGHFCPQGSPNATASACPAGTYNALEGQGDLSACIPCKVAHYCTEGTSEPEPCSTLAHPGFTTLSEGAEGPDACVCMVNSFRDPFQPPPGFGECTECPEGADCRADGAELGALPLYYNYWRAFNFSAVPRSCPRPHSCLAGIPEEDYRATSKSPGRANCEVGYTGVLCATCEDGYHAANAFADCELCPEGTENSLYGLAAAAGALVLAQVYGCYSQVKAQRAKVRKVLAKLGIVTEKPKKEGAIGRATKQVVAKWKAIKERAEASKAGVLVKKIKAMRAKAKAMQGKMEAQQGKVGAFVGKIRNTLGILGQIRNVVAPKKGGGGGGGGGNPLAGPMKGLAEAKTKFKILFSTLQITTNFSSVFSIQFPPMYSNLLQMASIVNLDLFTMVPIACIDGAPSTNYHNTLLMKTLIPLIIVLTLSFLGFAIDHVVSRGVESGRLRQVDHLVVISNQLQSNAFVIMLVVFPGNCVTIFRTFPCLHLDDNTRWLKADLSIDCDSPAHQSWVMYAWLMFLVYPVGVPLLQTFLLRFKYREILEHMKTLDAIPQYQASSEMYKQNNQKRPRPRVQSLLLESKPISTLVPELGLTPIGSRKVPAIAVRRVPIGYAKLLREEAAKAQPKVTAKKTSPASPPPSPPSSPPSQDTSEATAKMIKHEKKPATKEEAFLTLPKPVQNLVKPYNTNAAWFEIFETLRKLALVGPPIFLEGGSAEQLILGLLIAFCSALGYMAFRPFPKAGEDLLSQMSQVQIFVTLLSSIAIAAGIRSDEVLMLLALLPLLMTLVLETPLGAPLLNCTERKKEGEFAKRRKRLLLLERLGHLRDEKKANDAHAALVTGLRSKWAARRATSSVREKLTSVDWRTTLQVLFGSGTTAKEESLIKASKKLQGLWRGTKERRELQSKLEVKKSFAVRDHLEGEAAELRAANAVLKAQLETAAASGYEPPPLVSPPLAPGTEGTVNVQPPLSAASEAEARLARLEGEIAARELYLARFSSMQLELTSAREQLEQGTSAAMPKPNRLPSPAARRNYQDLSRRCSLGGTAMTTTAAPAAGRPSSKGKTPSKAKPPGCWSPPSKGSPSTACAANVEETPSAMEAVDHRDDDVKPNLAA